MDWIGAKVN